jgi:hypothetical protein
MTVTHPLRRVSARSDRWSTPPRGAVTVLAAIPVCLLLLTTFAPSTAAAVAETSGSKRLSAEADYGPPPAGMAGLSPAEARVERSRQRLIRLTEELQLAVPDPVKYRHLRAEHDLEMVENAAAIAALPRRGWQ